MDVFHDQTHHSVHSQEKWVHMSIKQQVHECTKPQLKTMKMFINGRMDK